MKLFLLGIIQGITEFLPISSSGHLYFIQRIMDLRQNLLAFFVFLHLATLFAVVVFFRATIIKMFTDKVMLRLIAITTVITCAIALAIKVFISGLFGNSYLLAFCFLINSAILLGIKNISKDKGISQMANRDALLLGLVQGLAVFPGISRSGVTISSLLKLGYKRKDAFVFSFIIAIPIMVIAFLAGARELAGLSFSASTLAVSFLAAFITGLAAIKIVKATVINKKFHLFGYYTLLMAFFSVLFA
jgi:undecaprenyl-diphosphatase